MLSQSISASVSISFAPSEWQKGSRAFVDRSITRYTLFSRAMKSLGRYIFISLKDLSSTIFVLASPRDRFFLLRTSKSAFESRKKLTTSDHGNSLAISLIPTFHAKIYNPLRACLQKNRLRFPWKQMERSAKETHVRPLFEENQAIQGKSINRGWSWASEAARGVSNSPERLPNFLA